jgi:site-specific recombinase XerD
VKIKDPALFKQIKEYLTTYLPVIRRRSTNTVSSNREALNLFLLYLQNTQNKKLSEVTTIDFKQANIVGFMSWLQHERGNTATTVNQRLSHIRSFCRQLMKNDALSYGDLSDINDICRIKDIRTNKLILISIKETKMLLKQPDDSKKTGIRDRFYLALLYDSGCRNEEIINLK